MVFITRFNLVLVWSKIVQYLTKKSSKWDRRKQVSWSSLEIINLLTIGITFFNCKLQVPSDISTYNSFTSAENMKTQEHIDIRANWNIYKHMLVYTTKSRLMILNFPTSLSDMKSVYTACIFRNLKQSGLRYKVNFFTNLHLLDFKSE